MIAKQNCQGRKRSLLSDNRGGPCRAPIYPGYDRLVYDYGTLARGKLQPEFDRILRLADHLSAEDAAGLSVDAVQVSIPIPVPSFSGFQEIRG